MSMICCMVAEISYRYFLSVSPLKLSFTIQAAWLMATTKYLCIVQEIVLDTLRLCIVDRRQHEIRKCTTSPQHPQTVETLQNISSNQLCRFPPTNKQHLMILPMANFSVVQQTFTKSCKSR